jgi:hypothetical protein
VCFLPNLIKRSIRNPLRSFNIGRKVSSISSYGPSAASPSLRASGRLSSTLKALQRLVRLYETSWWIPTLFQALQRPAVLYRLAEDFPLLFKALQRLVRLYETSWWIPALLKALRRLALLFGLAEHFPLLLRLFNGSYVFMRRAGGFLQVRVVFFQFNPDSPVFPGPTMVPSTKFPFFKPCIRAACRLRVTSNLFKKHFRRSSSFVSFLHALADWSRPSE